MRQAASLQGVYLIGVFHKAMPKGYAKKIVNHV